MLGIVFGASAGSGICVLGFAVLGFLWVRFMIWFWLIYANFSMFYFVRPENPRSAAKSSLQAVTAEQLQTEIPAPERLPGACTSQGHVSPDHKLAGPGAGCFPVSGLGIDFRLATIARPEE